MPALTAGHVKEAILFVTRGNHEPLGSALIRCLNAGHVDISWERLGGHIQKALQDRHGMAERMLNPASISLTPRPLGQLRSIGSQREQYRIHRDQDLLIPAFELRRKQVNRSFGNQLPQWPFSLASGEEEIKSRVGGQASGGQRSEDLPLEERMKRSHRPIADAINRRSSAPVLDV